MKHSASRQFFWQTVLAILLGVIAGCLLLSITQRRPAEALTKSPPPFNGSSLPVQILPMLSQRMTVLVLGVDSNGLNAERFTNTRSDTMILVSMDPLTRKVGVISIPRDSRVKISGNHGMDKINAAHAFGGPQLSMQTVSENFSVPIDHYVVVDTTALKELCQLLGPVPVMVEKEMHYQDYAAHLHIDLKPGLQVLSPEQVEQYVRYRHDAKGDIGRIERQQWFFRAAAHKLQDPQFLLRLPELIRLAHDYVQTDLSLEDMARIAGFARDVKPADILTATLPGTPEMIGGGSYWVPDIDGSRAVFNRVLGLNDSGNFVAADANSSQTINSSGSTVEQNATSPLPAVSSGTSGSNTSLDERDSSSAPAYKPLVVGIRYPRGAEATAAALEARLVQSGYNVRYKWQMPLPDCQHEQIIQMSAKADDGSTDKMRAAVPELSFWPVALQLDSKPIVDFTLVISPGSQFAQAPATASNVVPGSRPIN